jgi:hypothetical protein
MSTRGNNILRHSSSLKTAVWLRWYEHGLHAALLLEVFRSESRDEILLRGEGCNTPDVYIPLDNEYGFKHAISVDKTDFKF